MLFAQQPRQGVLTVDEMLFIANFNSIKHSTPADEIRSAAASSLELLLSGGRATTKRTPRSPSAIKFAPTKRANVTQTHTPSTLPPARRLTPEITRGAPTNLGSVGSKAPKQVTPGVRELEGHYINDRGISQPWRAHYDEYGRLIGRTDYNAGNRAAGIPDVHYHRYQWGPGKIAEEIGSHIPGELTP